MGIVFERRDELIGPGENGPLEPIRLVIWDLDETFWKGTLTEGGIEIIPNHCALVKTLAVRGIISSICSRNDHDVVARILSEHDIWNYFVMPSINWQAKAPRLRSLITALNLRAASAIFIDDNHVNREEAKTLVAGLIVSDPGVIANMASLPQFAGKSDPNTMRLGQYKLLEQRQIHKREWGNETIEFLRNSNIVVTIEHNIEKHQERAVELINRTNQLNFVKSRLPEDIQLAKAELGLILARHNIQAGLIRLTDRYGDHGFCGIYILQGGWKLLQFAFSCRIIGMGVERWLYQRLGRPELQATGDDLAKLLEDTSVDWIHESDCSPDKISAPADARWVAARGGCDLQAVAHYLNLAGARSVDEFNFNRHGCDVRIDHSMFLRYAVSGLPEGGIEACKLAGYCDEDFRTRLLEPRSGRGIWLLSFWSDAVFALYRHRASGVVIPWNLPGWHDQAQDVAGACLEELSLQHGSRDHLAAPLHYLKENFEYLGLISEDLFKQNLKIILGAAPRGTRVIILGANEKLWDPEANFERHAPQYRAINAWTRAVARWRRNVTILEIREFIASESEVHNWSHFDRKVYFRVFQKVQKLIGRRGQSRKHA